jgi:carbamoyltransferase
MKIRLTRPLYTLGISAFYHDSAAALLRDGQIVAAAQQERFSRIKHDSGFPSEAARYCLDVAGIALDDVDIIAFYDKPLLKFERLLETYYAFAPRGIRSFVAAMPVWLKEKLLLRSIIREELEKLDRGVCRGKLLFPEHHLSHAASAFYPSPFREAAILTIDGVGEYATTTLGLGRGKDITIFKEIHFPHSLGLLYSAFTYHTGFKVNSGEYKVMGLAPYGSPRYADKIYHELIDVKEDGSFRLNMKYFSYATGLRMTNGAFDELFGHAPREPESPVTQHEMDMAASVQKVTEDIMLKLARFAAKQTGMKNLTLAGGVALNCVANGHILREGIFKNLWIQPASGDAGGALGAALAAWHIYLGNERETDGRTDSMQGAYLGPEFSDAQIAQRLQRFGAVGFHYDDEEALLNETARLIDEGKVIGWLQGRMEFGPRALGGRSILGDARKSEMQKKMNLKIKFRESFRPFAPSVMVEMVSEYFNLDYESPYMLLVDYLRPQRSIALTVEQKKLFGIDKLNIPRSDVPAITHIDYSARIQTVDRAVAPRYWKLLEAFRKRTGYGIFVNTSFNVRGEPIVCTPEDAYHCFMRTEMDYLIAGNWIFAKKDQPEFKEEKDWRDLYKLD